MRRVAQQIAAIEMRDDPHAGRQDVIVQFLHLFVDRRKRGLGVGTLAHQNVSFYHVIVIEQMAVLAANGFSDLSQSNPRALDHVA